MRWFLTLAAVLMLTACSSSAAKPAPAQTADQIVAALKAAGRPIGDALTYTAANDPNSLLGRPNGYTSKTAFYDTGLPQQNPSPFDVSDGGSVELFANNAGAQARMTYIQTIAKGLPALTEYDYVQGGALLRLSARLTPDQAAQYAAAFRAAVR